MARHEIFSESLGDLSGTDARGHAVPAAPADPDGVPIDP
jgi:hypothetical protein